MPIPASVWIAAGSAAAGAVGSALSSRSQNKTNQQITAAELAQQKELAQQNTAADESKLDPFRQQMSQAGDLSSLDQLQYSTYSPVQLDLSGNPYASYVPKVSGGFQYQKSPELVNAAGALKSNVLGGNTAPSMTDPANYGKTATLALNPDGTPKNGVNPNTAGPAKPGLSLSTDGLNTELNDIVDDYGRRGGGTGGVGHGAATGAMTGLGAAKWLGPYGWAVGAGGGAAIGAIVGAATKHAKSAPTDFSVDDARAAVTRTYQEFQHRTPAPEEVDAVIKGQGWKPGDRWVGQGGLMSVLNAIAKGAA